MARLTFVLSTLIALIALSGYRSRYLLLNTFLPSHGLPTPYYGKGRSCRVASAPDMSSCEDIRFWNHAMTNARRIVLACDPDRFDADSTPSFSLDDPQRSGLWIVDTAGPGPSPQRISLENFPAIRPFHPIGFDVSSGQPNAPSRLYVANNAADGTEIEEFEIGWDSPTSARWIRSLSDPSLPAPNAIALAPDDSLFVSNDHRFPPRRSFAAAMLETVLVLPISHIVHVSFSSPSRTPQFSIAASGIPFPNGVALSQQADTLAVASTSGTSVRFYKRNATTNALTFTEEILVPFAPDNLSFDDSDRLLVAGHPNLPTLIAMSKGLVGDRAPSWVVGINRVHASNDSSSGWDTDAILSASRKVPRPPQGWSMETLYQSSGGQGYTSSSTALLDGKTGRLFVTGLFEDGMLVCGL